MSVFVLGLWGSLLGYAQFAGLFKGNEYNMMDTRTMEDAALPSATPTAGWIESILEVVQIHPFRTRVCANGNLKIHLFFLSMLMNLNPSLRYFLIC